MLWAALRWATALGENNNIHFLSHEHSTNLNNLNSGGVNFNEENLKNTTTREMSDT